MSGGGGDQVIQKTTTDPWSGIQPNLTQIGGDAKKLYEAGIGPSYYPGATYVPPTTQELVGMQGMQNLATQGNQLLPGLLNTAKSQITGGGLSAEQRGGLDPLKRIASGQDSISVVQPMGYRSQGGGLAPQSAPGGGVNIDPDQGPPGGFSGGGNPYLMAALGISADRAKSSMESSFGGMGRGGGGGQPTGVIGREIGNLYSTGLSNQMNADLDRRMAAEGANIANRAGAASQLQNVYGQGANNALAWGGMSGDIRNQQFGDASKLVDVGAAQRGELQAENQSYIDRYNAQQSRPWDQLSLYNNIIGGLAPGSGSQTVTGQKGSPLAGILGGGAVGAGLLGQLLGFL